MPYLEAANASDAGADATAGPGGGSNPISNILGCLCVLMVIGVVCIGLGISKLAAATVDKRGDDLKAYSKSVKNWDFTGKETFEALKFNVNGAPMTAKLETVKASTFGEDSLDVSSKVKTPDTQDVAYSAAFTPPSLFNRKRKLSGALYDEFKIATGTGTIVHSEMVKQTRSGTTLKSSLCQYYDSDFTHPMTTMGMGVCQTGLNGPWGPKDCVDDKWADVNGCPNDVISTTVAQNFYGNTWNGVQAFQQYFTTQRKRFDYNAKKKVCFDYSDCFCKGPGNMVFKTDTTKGYAMSGYGYGFNGHWNTYPKAIDQMTPEEKAGVCFNIMSNSYFTLYGGIKRSQVSLVCFAAGGFPKPKCSTWCPAGGYNQAGIANWAGMGSQYSNNGQQYNTAGYYNQYGANGGRSLRRLSSNGGSSNGAMQWNTALMGAYPMCTYEERVNSINIQTDNTGVKKSVAQTVVRVGAAGMQTRTVINVRITSTQGPINSALATSKKCKMSYDAQGLNPKITGGPTCFGNTQAQNAGQGAIFLAIGGIMLFVPCVLGFLLMRGLVKM